MEAVTYEFTVVNVMLPKVSLKKLVLKLYEQLLEALIVYKNYPTNRDI